MFTVSVTLKNSIVDRLKLVEKEVHDLVFKSGDCSCSGSCGTYVEPCGCCAYHSGKDD